MGKRLITQRRGAGNPRFLSPSSRYLANIEYPKINYETLSVGQVIDLVHDAARSAPIMKVILDGNFSETLLIAPEGISVGRMLQFGRGANVAAGSVLPIETIPEGTEIYCIEIRKGDGGKLVRSSGTFAQVVSHDRILNLTEIRLPSKKTIHIKNGCLATVGRVAGGGRKDKLMAHAGQMFYAKKARGKLWPVVKGRAKNAVDHPHGGGRHPHVGRPTTVSRDTPAGRKVGHIAAKRTGKRKK
ncbi:50S ribosomal protein L2 [uncultured archaeon]|nr:50S ribosomal protein L2 [uncultured archaeon]